MEEITLRNCDELLDFLYNNVEEPINGEVDFQGDTITLGGYMPDAKGLIMTSHRHKRAIFIVGNPTNNDTFILSIIDRYGHLDQTYGAEVPMYVRDEMIATIDWY